MAILGGYWLRLIDFKLYAITNRRLCKPRLIQDYVASLLDIGVRAIQLREKDLSDTELRSIAVPINRICKAYSAKLFINSKEIFLFKLVNFSNFLTIAVDKAKLSS